MNRLRDGVISLCQKERFLSIIHDFIIFDAGVKKVTRHNQYFANIAATFVTSFECQTLKNCLKVHPLIKDAQS